MDDILPQKICSSCKNPYPATPDYFACAPTKRDGLSYKCKECARAYTKARYQIPEIQEHKKAWSRSKGTWENRKDQRKAYEQRAESKFKRRIRSARQRSKRKLVIGHHTAEQIQDLLKRQRHKCYYCSTAFEKKRGKYVYHVDHTFPINRMSGTDIPANDISYLVLACPSCNHKKSDKFPWEFPEGGRLL